MVTHLSVMFTSIRAPLGVLVTPYTRPKCAPSFLKVDDKTRNWNKKHTLITDERLASLECIVKNAVDRQAYGRLKVEQVFLCGNPLLNVKPEKHKYIVTVKGKGNCYCLNVRRDHFSNRIYFEVTPKGVVQRCFGQRTRVRGCISGTACPRYKSTQNPISGEHRKKLFPRFVPKH